MSPTRPGPAPEADIPPPTGRTRRLSATAVSRMWWPLMTRYTTRASSPWNCPTIDTGSPVTGSRTAASERPMSWSTRCPASRTAAKSRDAVNPMRSPTAPSTPAARTNAPAVHVAPGGAPAKGVKRKARRIASAPRNGKGTGGLPNRGADTTSPPKRTASRAKKGAFSIPIAFLSGHIVIPGNPEISLRAYSTSTDSIHGIRRASVSTIASILGRNVSDDSWTWVAAWRIATTRPTAKPMASTGSEIFTAIQSASRAKSVAACTSPIPSSTSRRGPAAPAAGRRRSRESVETLHQRPHDQVPPVDQHEEKDLERDRDQHRREDDHAHRHEDRGHDHVDDEEGKEQRESHDERPAEL